MERQVTALGAEREGERSRRTEAEAALGEASAAFRRELADKDSQLEQLRQELR